MGWRLAAETLRLQDCTCPWIFLGDTISLLPKKANNPTTHCWSYRFVRYGLHQRPPITYNLNQRQTFFGKSLRDSTLLTRVF